MRRNLRRLFAQLDVRRWWRELDRATRIELAGVFVLALLTALGLLSGLQPSAWFYVYTLLLFALFYGAISLQVMRAAKREVSFLLDPEVVVAEAIAALRRARRSIVVIGRKEYSQSYLSALTEKIKGDSIPYWRVLEGDKIHKALCEHICEVLTAVPGKVHIHHESGDRYGTTFVADDTVIITFASPEGDSRFSGIKIVDAQLARDYREFVFTICAGQLARRIGSMADMSEFCRGCGGCPTPLPAPAPSSA